MSENRIKYAWILRNCAEIAGNESGVVLLITLSIIAILFTFSLELNHRVRITATAAENSKNECKLMAVAESGLNIAEAILLKDAHENQIDSVQEEWANPEALDYIIKSLGFDTNNLKLKITDEMGKIQVNALIKEYPGHEVDYYQKQIWEKFLSFFMNTDKAEDKRNPLEIINCLIDWLDDKDGEAVTGISGAESEFYESLNIPYKCANKNIYDLNELFFIKGISKTIFLNAGNFDNLLLNGKELENRTMQFQLDDLLTVFGIDENKYNGHGTDLNSVSDLLSADNEKLASICCVSHIKSRKYHFTGKININTAPIPVIAAILPPGKEELAGYISEFRIKKLDGKDNYSNDLSINNWYVNVVGLTEHETEEINKIITNSSNIFSIESYATLKGRLIVLKCVIERQQDKNGKWYCKKLMQQIE